MALASLHTKKPREKSGSRTSSRFEFQANFSILKILDLHESGDDYRVLFDHFDDLTILNSSNAPTRIKFCQIKGRDSGKHWTIKQLVKEDNTHEPDSTETLYKNKSLSRAQIAGLIERASKNRSFETAWQIIVSELQTASVPSIQIIRIKNASLRYLRERARGDKISDKFSSEIRDIIKADISAIASSSNIIDAADLLRNKLKGIYPYTNEDLLGALLVETYEALP